MRILFFLLSMLLQKHTGHCTSGDFFQISSVSDEIRRDQLLDAITPYGNVWLKTIHAEKVSVDGDISEIILTDFKDLATFLEIATEQPKYAINLLRFIASEIKKTSFRHFRLEFVPSSEGLKLIFKNTSKEL